MPIRVAMPSISHIKGAPKSPWQVPLPPAVTCFQPVIGVESFGGRPAQRYPSFTFQKLWYVQYSFDMRFNPTDCNSFEKTPPTSCEPQPAFQQAAPLNLFMSILWGRHGIALLMSLLLRSASILVKIFKSMLVWWIPRQPIGFNHVYDLSFQDASFWKPT